MNLRGGWALIKATWLSWMESRGFFALIALGWMIQPLVYMLVWSTAAGEAAINGLTRGDFVFYYLTLILVDHMTHAQTNWTVGDIIRYGDLDPLLARPLPIPLNTLSYEVASRVVILTVSGPLAALLALLLRPTLPVTTAGAAAFVPALLLAWMLRFFWGYWLALLAFWATRADGLLALQDSLTFLLAGQVAPVRLLPGAMRTAAQILPFRYMLGFPVEVLTGQVAGADVWRGLALQAGWLLAAIVLYIVLWRAGLQRHTAVGG